MPSRSKLVLLFVQTLAISARSEASSHAEPPKSAINWGKCNFKSTETIECGNLTVPLDYTEPNSGETLTLELLRVPAKKNPSKGSVLVNFGGPGDIGREDLASSASLLQATTGGQNDLVTFDPRGTGNTLPFSCYKTQLERLVASLSVPSVAGNSSDTALGRIWGKSEIVANACLEEAKKVGGLVGTAFVARDMMRIVDALDEDGMLRYWGFSYGTALGATAAAMFPERMDRVILDGVLNPHQYYHANDIQEYTDTDKTFSAYLSECVKAGPKRCALARRNKTASELEEMIYGLMEELKYHPLPVQGQLYDWTTLRGFILLTLYNPSGYAPLARILDGLLDGDTTVLGETSGGDLSTVPDEPRYGIMCGDKSRRLTDLADIIPPLERLFQKSRIAGDTAAYQIMQCARWKMDAKERYQGDFHVQTKTPVLVIGNTFDPVTPYVSAQNITHAFAGSVALRHDGFGHTSTGQFSLCTAKVIQEYLHSGKLPEKDTVCEMSVPLFSDKTWEDVVGNA